MLQAVNPVIPGIAAIAPELVEVRRRIHAHPGRVRGNAHERSSPSCSPAGV